MKLGCPTPARCRCPTTGSPSAKQGIRIPVQWHLCNLVKPIYASKLYSHMMLSLVVQPMMLFLVVQPNWTWDRPASTVEWKLTLEATNHILGVDLAAPKQTMLRLSPGNLLETRPRTFEILRSITWSVRDPAATSLRMPHPREIVCILPGLPFKHKFAACRTWKRQDRRSRVRDGNNENITLFEILELTTTTTAAASQAAAPAAATRLIDNQQNQPCASSSTTPPPTYKLRALG